MRVVAGAHRGRRLQAPPGRGVRPTADRVREALFSILGPLDGLEVLDLFAGSGALGIEALSRGAREVVFVDSEPAAVRAVRDNLARLGVAAPVYRSDAIEFLERPRHGPFHLIFLDPPYSAAHALAGPLSQGLPALLAPEARIVTESLSRNPLELPMPLTDERIYGDTRIGIHRAG